MSFHIEKKSELVTDFSEDGGFQKCVRFSADSSLLLTGGADGHVRVWKVSCSLTFYVSPFTTTS